MSNYSALIAKSHTFRQEAQGSTGFEGTMPPSVVLDRIAEQSISGGYDLSSDNLCPECFQYRSACGGCGCE